MSTNLIRLSRWLCVSFLLLGCTAQGAGLPPMPMTPAASLSAAALGPVPPATYYSTPSSNPSSSNSSPSNSSSSTSTESTAAPTARPTATPAPTATASPVNLNGPLTVALDPGLPEEW